MEIVVASGKGGTGKTTVSSFLISYYSKIKGLNVIGVDADVEAPDLLITLGKHEIIERRAIFDSKLAVISYEKCISCGECYNVCQFGAVDWDNKPVILEPLCEGCGACKIVCPTEAIDIIDAKTGDLVVAKTNFGIIITGILEIGKRHSGHMVEILKSEARKYNSKLIIVDAAAGTGCSVISSIAGSDYLVIVIEPTPQSLRTAKKIFEIGKSFGVRMGAIINKADLNPEFAPNIVEWSKMEHIDFLGEVPYDANIVKAYANMRALIEFAPNSRATRALGDIATRLYSLIRG